MESQPRKLKQVAAVLAAVIASSATLAKSASHYSMIAFALGVTLVLMLLAYRVSSDPQTRAAKLAALLAFAALPIVGLLVHSACQNFLACGGINSGETWSGELLLVGFSLAGALVCWGNFALADRRRA